MQTIDLNGKWKFKAIDAYGSLPSDKRSVRRWMIGTVPGTVHLDLMANGKIPDPFYRTNEHDVQWVDKQQWLYKREYIAGEELLKEDRIDLVMEGLDTYARIHCNGRFVGETQNMFVAHRFDIKKYLRPGRNFLQILFDSPVVRSQRTERRHGTLEVALNSYRVYARKAQYSFGWDWGPTLATSGIWRSAYLEAVSGGRLSSPFVKILSIKKDEAIVEASVDVERFRRGPFFLFVTVESEHFVKEVRLPVRGRKAKTRIRIPHPQLWWPNGHGDQPLYKAVFSLVQGDQECRRVEVRFGLRTVRLRQDPDADGRSFLFEINGRKIFCKGADWIPSDSFLPRVTEEKYSTLLQMAKDAHMNMLRVWGGGIYENREFYDLCDRLGLMVWHDFMFACGEYPEEPWFLREAKDEARKVVRSLRYHPSIVLWCGNNECEWLYCTQHPDKSPDDMRGAKIFRDVLPTVCREEDGTRPYWRSSPYGKGFPNDESNGNHHQWNVWSLWNDYPEYEKDNARFVTEFGFQSLADLKTWKTITTSRDRHPQSAVLEHHNKQVDGTERLMRFQAAHYPMTSYFEEFVYQSQLTQADALKCAVEHWRRRMFRTAGALFWQLNDCWPVSSWSVIDYNLRPKAAYYYAKRFFAPLLVSFRRTPAGMEVWLTNDTLKRTGGDLRIVLRSFRGRTVWRKNLIVNIPANSSRKVFVVASRMFSHVDPTSHYLHAVLSDGGGLLAENRFYFKEPKHLRLPKSHIDVKVRVFDEGSCVLFLKSKVFAKSVYVEEKGKGKDAVFDDNYFDLDPGVTKQIDCYIHLSATQLQRRLRLHFLNAVL